MKKLLLYITFILIYCRATLAGVSLTGTNGLINTPTAEVTEDRQVFFGYGFIEKCFAQLGNLVADNHSFYFTIGYLPNLELSLKTTFAPNLRGNDLTDTYKDGAFSVQYRILKETKHRPAIAIGLHDFYSYSFFNAFFVVASKDINILHKFPIRLHLGYGVDWIKKHWGDTGPDRNAPVPHHLVGLFGGLELGLHKYINLMLEYDTEKFNSGIRFNFFHRMQLDVDLLHLDTLSGGVNFKFKL